MKIISLSLSHLKLWLGWRNFIIISKFQSKMVYYVLLLSTVGLWKLSSWEILTLPQGVCLLTSNYEQEREEETCTNSSLSPIVLLIRTSDSKTRFLQLRLLQYLWHWKVSRHTDLWDHFPSSKVCVFWGFQWQRYWRSRNVVKILIFESDAIIRRTIRSLPRAPAQKTPTTHRRYPHTPSCRGNETMFEIKLGGER